jgi:hypothetical protein
MASTEELETYLNDHLAGSVTGSELADKLAEVHAGTAAGPVLSELAKEIMRDRMTLTELMDRMGIDKSTVKQASGWVGEKATRLKLSDVAIPDQNLKQLLEFETLSLGIEGKRSLWRALREVREAYPELIETDLDGLVERAEHQRSMLEDHRLAAARRAFSP